MKLLLALTLILGTSSVLANTPARTAAPTPKAAPEATLPAKKTKPLQAAKKPQSKVPKTLPSYKGPKRIVLDFEKEPGTAGRQTKVIARTPLPLEKALEDQATAATAQNDMTKPIPPSTNFTAEALSEGRVLPSRPRPAAPAPVTSAVPDFDSRPVQPFVLKSTADESDHPAAGLIIVEPAAEPAFGSLSTAPSPAEFADDKSAGSSRERRADLNTGSLDRRLHLRGAFINAKYSELESRLDNGSTAMGVGLSYGLDPSLEGRLALDIAHGLDQAVTPENTRMVTARGEIAMFFQPGKVRPYVAGGLGYATYNVTSVRSAIGDTLTVKRHASGSALLFAPAAGVRLEANDQLSVDLQAEYLGLLGGDKSSSIGGFSMSAALGLRF